MNELSESTSTSKRIKKKPQKAKLIKEMVSLFFSVDIMVFDFPHFLFFQVQYIDILLQKSIGRKITWKFQHIFLWKSLSEKRIRRLALSVLR